MRFIESIIGKNSYLVNICDTIHIFPIEKMETIESEGMFAGIIRSNDNTYPIFDVRERIEAYAGRKEFSQNEMTQNERIIILMSEIILNIHFQDVRKKIAIGFIVDKIDRTIDFDDKSIRDFERDTKYDDGKKIKVAINDKELLLLTNFDDYLTNDEKLKAYNLLEKEKTRRRESIEKKNHTIENSYSKIFEKNHIENLWKKKHLNKQ